MAERARRQVWEQHLLEVQFGDPSKEAKNLHVSVADDEVTSLWRSSGRIELLSEATTDVSPRLSLVITILIGRNILSDNRYYVKLTLP